MLVVEARYAHLALLARLTWTGMHQQSATCAGLVLTLMLASLNAHRVLLARLTLMQMHQQSVTFVVQASSAAVAPQCA